MKRFAQLYNELDSSTKPDEKSKALICYLQNASEEDRLWAIALLTNRKPKRIVQTRVLKTWANELNNIPSWLFEESLEAVGDLVETLSLSLPEPTINTDESLSHWILKIKEQEDKEELEKKDFVQP